MVLIILSVTPLVAQVCPLVCSIAKFMLYFISRPSSCVSIVILFGLVIAE